VFVLHQLSKQAMEQRLRLLKLQMPITAAV